jgi:hypothetical protein
VAFGGHVEGPAAGGQRSSIEEGRVSDGGMKKPGWGLGMCCGPREKFAGWTQPSWVVKLDLSFRTWLG